MSAKISDLTAGSALGGTERFEAEQPAATTSVYLTAAQIAAFILASPTVTGHMTVEGVTAAGATGTNNIVFSNSPTLVTPVLGVASATSLAIGAGSAITSSGPGGALTSAAFTSIGTSGATIPLLSTANTWTLGQTYSAAMTYGGVTLSNAVTGTGNMVLATTPTLTTPVIGAATGTSLSLSTGASNVTIAPATANTEPLTVTMGTMTANTKGINLTATFNNAAVAGTPLFVNVTNTSSAAAALMADYQVGGTSRFKLPVNTAARSAIFSEEGSTGFIFQYSAATDNAFILQPNTNAVLFGATFTSTGAFKPIDFYTSLVAFRLDTTQNFIGTLGSTIGFGASSASTLNQASITADTVLSRFGVGTLGLSDSTTATILQTYNTTDSTTSPTNYERFTIKWSSNSLQMLNEAGGTGTLRNLYFRHGGTGVGFARTDASGASGFSLFSSALTEKVTIGTPNGASDLVTGSAVGDFIVRTLTTGNVWFSTDNATSAAKFSVPANATFQFGGNAAASPVAQITRVQSVVGGTAATAGANWTLIGSLSTGTGTSGDIILQTGVNPGSGTTQATATTALTIKGETQNCVFAGQVTTVASTTAKAGLNLPSGTAPTSPANGDLWYDGTNLMVRLNGATKTVTAA